MSQTELTEVSALGFEKEIAALYQKITDLERAAVREDKDFSGEIRVMREQYISMLEKTYSELSAWQVVQVSRHPQRPLAKDYIEMIAKNFTELHGDRRFGDDPAIIGGLAKIGTEKVMLITQHKGRDTKEKLKQNFGMPVPEGYRKALRLMKMAEKFNLPIVTLIDTPGAYPGIGSEERGVAEAIAVNLREMSVLNVPVVCIVIGEGGSGGALGIAVGDKIAVLQYAYYSVISPEGCASILWRTGEAAPEAAEALQLTGERLKELGVIDDVVAEPLGGAHRNPTEMAHNLEQYIVKTLRALKRKKVENLVNDRYKSWRAKGQYLEVK